jgi:hypothetical protein
MKGNFLGTPNPFLLGQFVVQGIDLFVLFRAPFVPEDWPRQDGNPKAIQSLSLEEKCLSQKDQSLGSMMFHDGLMVHAKSHRWDRNDQFEPSDLQDMGRLVDFVFVDPCQLRTKYLGPLDPKCASAKPKGTGAQRTSGRNCTIPHLSTSWTLEWWIRGSMW